MKHGTLTGYAGARAASERARAYALRNGWAPPLGWDDDEIDDPKALPHRRGRRAS